MDQEHNREPALAAYTEAERHEAMRRFVVLRPHLNELCVGHIFLFRRVWVV
jgi:hypothetical protein